MHVHRSLVQYFKTSYFEDSEQPFRHCMYPELISSESCQRATIKSLVILLRINVTQSVLSLAHRKC